MLRTFLQQRVPSLHVGGKSALALQGVRHSWGSWKALATPPSLPEDLRVAVPERAVLTLLYEAGDKQSLEEARNVFDGLRSPRKDLLGQVLSCSTRVKAVHLL